MDSPKYTPILKTKLQIPGVPPSLVNRARLVEKLDQGLRWGKNATLVSASAGFGKTTLLSEWAHGRDTQQLAQFTWLALEEEDNYPGRFWVYVTAALQVGFPEIGEVTMAMLRSPEIPTCEVFLTPLLNEISVQAEKVVLVLDDFQYITGDEILAGVDFLVEHLPPQLHITISTRADPALPIVRWRGQGKITELRGDELNFTQDEVITFLNTQLHLNLGALDIEVLATRTEGWITGLKLAAISMKSRKDHHEFICSLAKNPFVIIEYLTEEVLKDQLPEIRDFLLQTSILSQLNGSLCDHVLERQDSTGILEALYRDNMFITPLDFEHQWFHYHPLFIDLLRDQLYQTKQDAKISTLHQRASRWYAENGYLQLAIKHANRAGEPEVVADLVEQAAQASLVDSWMTNLLAWLEMLPSEILRSRLRLRIYQACALFFDGQTRQCMQILEESTRALQLLTPSPENRQLREELGQLLEIIYCFVEGLSLSLQGRLVQSDEVMLRSKQLAEGAGSTFLLAHAYEGLALNQYHRGELRAAAVTSQKLIEVAGSSSEQPLPIAAAGYLLLANICLDQDRLEDMHQHVNQAVELSRKSGGAKSLVEAYVIKSRLQQAQGDLEGAIESINKAESAYHLRSSLLTRFRLESQKARLDLQAGKPDKVVDWVKGLQAADITVTQFISLPLVLFEASQLLLARGYLIKKEPEKTLAILEQIQEEPKAAERNRPVVEILMLRALAFQALSQEESAIRQFERALKKAEVEGIKRVFIDGTFGKDDSSVQQLLFEAVERQITPDFSGALLASFPRSKSEKPQPVTELGETLSEREIEVLEQLAKGLSNQEIARQLVISLQTVKTHTGNIYGKLGVHNRTQAVLKAKVLGLIDQ